MSNTDFDPNKLSAVEQDQPTPNFDPNKLAAVEFDPNKLAATPTSDQSDFVTAGTRMAGKLLPGPLGAVAKAADYVGLPQEIYRAGKQALSSINDNLNPWSDAAKNKQDKLISEAKSRPFWDISPGIEQALDVGKGLAAVPALVAAPVTGASRVAIGKPYSYLTGAPFHSEDVSPADRAAGQISGEEAADTAMMGLRPAGAPVKTLPRPGAPSAPNDIPPTRPAYEWDPTAGKNPPVAPSTDPLGVTLTEGQATGNRAAIQREQAAARSPDILGNRAHEAATRFLERQQEQVAGAKERVAQGLGETEQNMPSRALSAQDAATEITDALTKQERARATQLANQERQLQRAHEAFRGALNPEAETPVRSPLDAATTLSNSINRAAEAAQEAKNAAYARAKGMPGEFHPAAFNKMVPEIQAELARSADPVFIDPQRTPLANAALGELDDMLSGLKQIRDPETGRILPKPPNTMQRVDIARQRINSYLSNAFRAARSDPGAWKDVHALGELVDAFDDAVARRINKGTFIGGDADAVNAAFQHARDLNAQYRRTFTPQGAGDKVGPAIRDIVGRHQGQAATPEQVNNILYGKGDLPVKIGRRLLSDDVFGPNSPEAGALRQGLFSYITEPSPGVGPWTPAKVADRIEGFTRGPGRTLTQTYLGPEHIQALNDYARALRHHDAMVNASRDSVDKLISELTGSSGVQPSTKYATDAIFQKALSGGKDSIELANRLKQRLSPMEYRTYQQGLFRHAIEQGNGLPDYGSKRIADNLTKLVNSQIGRAVYSPQQLALIRSLAELHRKLVIPQSGANWSNTAPTLAKWANRIGSTVGWAVGAAVGHAIGLPWGVAEGASLAATAGIKSVAGRLSARQILKQMPMVDAALVRYNKAAAAYARSQNPMSKAAIGAATANLGRTLQAIGVDVSKIPLQLPTTAPAEDNEKKRAEGGAVDDDAPFGDYTVTPDGRPNITVTPGDVRKAVGEEPLTPQPIAPPQVPLPPARPAEAPKPSYYDRQIAGPGEQRDIRTEGTGYPVIDKLMGLGGQERFQTWPEQMVRSGTTLPGDAYAGVTAPEQIQPTEPGFWSEEDEFRQQVANKAAAENVIHRAQDTAGLMGGASMPNAEAGAVGVAGGRPPIKNQGWLRPAIKFEGEVYTTPPGTTHGDTLNSLMSKKRFKDEPYEGFFDDIDAGSGFVTPDGKFLNREDALSYAKKNRQLDENTVSEDVGELDAAELLEPKRKGAILRSDTAKPAAPLSALENSFGRGWWFDSKSRNLHAIDAGELGPHGDHDGWITVGDNAQKLGVDPKKASAFQLATYHIYEPGKNPIIDSFFKEHPEFDSKFNVNSPEWEGGTFPPSISPEFDRAFERHFGISPEEAGAWRPESLSRVRLWPDGHMTVSGADLIKNPKKFVDELANAGALDSVKSINLSDYYDSFMKELTPEEFLSGRWRFNPNSKSSQFYSDTAKPGAALAAAERGPIWHSALENAIGASKQEAAFAPQWLGQLKNTPGVKPEELQWTGLEDYLKGQKGKLTKEDLQNYLDQNRVEVKDALNTNVDPNLAAQPGDVSELLATWRMNPTKFEVQKEGTHYVLRDNQNNKLGPFGSEDSAKAEMRSFHEALAKNDGDTLKQYARNAADNMGLGEGRYSSYVLPGGTNYNELLLTLPPGNKDYKHPQAHHNNDYTSPHWDEPNVLAHVRFNDRTINGKKTLFMEEVQSDWHQTGRKQGYRENNPQGWTAEKYENGYRVFDENGQEISRTRLAKTPEEAISRVANEHRYEAVPDAPFKKTWPELTLKRMVKYAADNGYDAIAWTPGEVQSKRWRGTGEEGHNKFYDEILVNAANKLGKGFGAKVGKAPLHKDLRVEGYGKQLSVSTPSGGSIRTFSDKNAAKEFAKSGQPVHYLELPQAMRDTARSKGMLLFSDTGKPGAPIAALEKSATPFYSQLQRTIEKAPQQKMHGSQWANWLRNQPGIKQEELEWTGLGNYLNEQKGLVNKEQVLAKAKENHPELQEAWKGEPTHSMVQLNSRIANALLDRGINRLSLERDIANAITVGDKDYALRRLRDQGVDEPVVQEIAKYAQDMLQDNRKSPRFNRDDLKLPGGENYRELLLKLPTEAKALNVEAKPSATGWIIFTNGERTGAVANPPGRRLTQQEAEAVGRLSAESNYVGRRSGEAYRSSHWPDDPNTVAHLRMNDRDIPGVGKSLHLEELQSDWGQAGRKEGYQDFSKRKLEVRPAANGDGWAVFDPEIGQVSAGALGQQDAEALATKWSSYKKNTGVPNMPFKQSWPDLLLKRAIREAAEQGKDAISWTPGEQQAARYDLSRQIRHIDYRPVFYAGKPNGGFELGLVGKHGEGIDLPKFVYTPEELPNVVGKDIADKIIKGEGERDGGRRTLRGLDLKIGGEGMKGFYDKMLVDKANAIGKKYGAKVEWKTLPNKDKAWDRAKHQEFNSWLQAQGDARTAMDLPIKELQELESRFDAEHGIGIKVPVLKLTPKLKDAALKEGFALFSDTGKPGAAISASEKKHKVPGKPGQEPHAGKEDQPQNRALGGRVEPRNINHNPSEAQKEAGNYAKDKLHFQGLAITIENAKGSTRRGVGKDGKPWACVVPYNYGYIRGSEGADQDHLDVALGPHLKSQKVFIVDQVDGDTKKFDEHKIFLGWGSKLQALTAYKKAFSDGKGAQRIGSVHEMTMPEFKAWLKNGDTKKPFAHAA